MIQKTALFALLDLVINELETQRDSLSLRKPKYPKVMDLNERELDAVLEFIALGGKEGRSTKVLQDYFGKTMNKHRVKLILDWLLIEEKIVKRTINMANFYSIKDKCY